MSETAMTKGSRKNKLAFWRERRAGRCKAPRRRRCSDIVEERQRRRCPPAAAPRRAAVPMHADYYSLMIMFLLRMGTAAKCQVILARALRPRYAESKAARRQLKKAAEKDSLGALLRYLCIIAAHVFIYSVRIMLNRGGRHGWGRCG